MSPLLERVRNAFTPALIALTIWHLALLATAVVVVVAAGNGPGNYTFAHAIWISTSMRVQMVFLWCTLPTVTTTLSLLDLLRRRTATLRRLVFSGAFMTTLYAGAFLLWGQCTYIGGTDACWTGNWSWYVWDKDPELLRYVLPWCALGTGLLYMAFTITGIVHLRRQRKAASEVVVQSDWAPGKTLSIDSSEIGTSSIGDQTLIFGRHSGTPSRQLSSAKHSTRPPTYYSSGDDSLLTVDEKEEKGGSVGYY